MLMQWVGFGKGAGRKEEDDRNPTGGLGFIKNRGQVCLMVELRVRVSSSLGTLCRLDLLCVPSSLRTSLPLSRFLYQFSIMSEQPSSSNAVAASPWHAKHPAPKLASVPVVTREQLLEMLQQDSLDKPPSFLLVDLRRMDHQVGLCFFLDIRMVWPSNSF